MWHDSSRKGGESFSLAGNKCTSLSRGKWEDVTIPKAAEVRWAVGLALPLTHSLTWNWESVRGMPGAAGPLWLGSLLGQSRAGVVTGKLKQQGRGNMSCCFKFRRGRSQSEDNFFSESCRAKVTNHGGLQINCTTGRRRNHLVTNQNPFFLKHWGLGLTNQHFETVDVTVQLIVLLKPVKVLQVPARVEI